MFTEPVDVCGSVLQKRDAIKKLLLGDRADSRGTAHIHGPPPAPQHALQTKEKTKNRKTALPG